MSDLPQGFNFDFRVAEPEKKAGGVLSYWVYHVHTKTSLPKFSQKELIVVRRYKDFNWLRDQLVAQYPGVIVPPIPEKAIAGSIEKMMGGNDPSALVEYRMRAMRKFLVRVGAHPQLQHSDTFREFLELGEVEFQKRVKEGSAKKDPIEMPQWLRLKGVLKKAPPPADTHRWDDTLDYFTQLSSQLTSLRDKFEMTAKRRRENGEGLLSFGRAFVRAGEREEVLEKTPLSNAIGDVGRHSEHLSLVYCEQADSEVIQVVETVGYYIGMCEAIKDVVRRLQRMISIRDSIHDSIAPMIAKRDVLPEGDPKNKLSMQIASTQDEHTKTSRLVSSFSDTFTEELKRFHSEKNYDLKQLLRTWSELQQEYASRLRNSWESLVPSVDAIHL
eukprot:Sspe_Gene.107081::Locus_85151_Transcript_1_1_Confidence_1.000_Length_1363::g.107081::m.107081/K17917/SNX1_2; sorting nexin-1/2